MEDPAGFLKYPRKEARKQGAGQRVRHWHEYEQVMPHSQACCQATRCMDCGTPDCHSYCPVHNLIPDWNELVHDTQWRSAWLELESTNNFPEFTGRLCPAPCEDACTLRLTDSPVTIRSIELAIAEHAWEYGWVKPQRSARQLFRRVAVIGSGPAGLACAQQLARTGYRVTVYEKSNRIGGLLRYGIPDFRIEKRVLDRRLQQLQAEGVIFRTGVEVGVQLDIEELRRTAHAVVLACGSEMPRDIDVPGRQLDGIHFAMDYLVQQNRRIAGDHDAHASVITAYDKDVVVIGGGDTGSDCVGTAIRQGARQVTQLQYHDRPPLHAEVRDYWPEHVQEWHETDHDAEGCRHVWGFDTVAFEGLEYVNCLILRQLRWRRRAGGGWDKQVLPGRARQLPVQLVLLAMGYAHPVHRGLVESLGLKLDECGSVSALETDYQTSTPGVFSCGDMRRGQSLIVWAIREGRQCARAVDVWLSGSSELPRM
jgi:glutamate synthase (NADPH/NADH) small chain